MDVRVLSPHEVVLVTDPAHPRYDPRVTHPPNEPRIASMLAYALPADAPEPDTPPIFPAAIIVREDNEAVTGRGRTRDLRVLWDILEEDGVPVSHRPHLLAFVATTEDNVRLLRMASEENSLRDPADDAVTTGVKIQRIVDVNEKKPKAERISLKEIAASFDMSDASARSYMKLVTAAPEVREAYRAGRITKSDALRIAALKDHAKQVSQLNLTPPAPAAPAGQGPSDDDDDDAGDEDSAEPRKRRPGKRGASMVPSVRLRQKVIETLGEGNRDSQVLLWTLGLNPKWLSGNPKLKGVK